MKRRNILSDNEENNNYTLERHCKKRKEKKIQDILTRSKIKILFSQYCNFLECKINKMNLHFWCKSHSTPPLLINFPIFVKQSRLSSKHNIRKVILKGSIRQHFTQKSIVE